MCGDNFTKDPDVSFNCTKDPDVSFNCTKDPDVSFHLFLPVDEKLWGKWLHTSNTDELQVKPPTQTLTEASSTNLEH